MLTERKAELLAVEYKLEAKLDHRIVFMAVILALVNIAVAIASVMITLNLAHALWHLHALTQVGGCLCFLAMTAGPAKGYPLETSA